MVAFKSSKATSILLSLGVVLGLVAIVFSQVLQYRNQEIKIEEIKAGDLQEGSITYDKLAEDVFTKVELEFENGVKGVAKVVNGRVENGILGGQLQFETEDGEIITGEVIGSIPVEVADGSITEEKLSKVLINRIERLEDEEESNNVEEEEESEIEEVIEEDESDDDDVYEIEDGSIVTVKLANSAVTTSKLADGSITTVKISDASITSGKIQDATILERDLANGSITSIKIEDGAITTSKLLDNSVTTAKIADGTILNNDISDSAGIVYSKLNLTKSLQLSDIGQNGCIDGQIIKWSSIESKWVCAEDTDTDTDTHLSESEVEEYITDEAIGLSIGSMIGSELIATRDWVEDKEYITDGNTNWDNTYGFITDGNTNWDNTYGFITASSTNTLTNKSGNISMWTNNMNYISTSGGSVLAGNGDDTGFGPATCPEGMIAVPPTNGRDGFCVDKYEAKQSGSIAVSQASGTPWVSITQYDARAACIAAGKHLITEAEWIQIAQNVEQVGWNWNGGVVGTNYMSDGHSDNSPASALEADVTGDPDDNPCVNTGQTCDINTWNTQRRTYRLSNGEYIWDFGGNVWEWVDAFTYANYPIANNWSGWVTCSNPDGICGNTLVTNDGKYGGNTTDLRAVLRGGTWPYDTADGAFSLLLHAVPSATNTYVGIRCAR